MYQNTVTLTEEDLTNLVGGITQGSAFIANNSNPFTADFVEGDKILPGFAGTANVHLDHSVPKVIGNGLSKLTATLKAFYEQEPMDHDYRLKANLDGAIIEQIGYNIGKKFDEEVLLGTDTIPNFDNFLTATPQTVTIEGSVPTASDITTAIGTAKSLLRANGFSLTGVIASNLAIITDAVNSAGQPAGPQFLGSKVSLAETNANIGPLTIFAYDVRNNPVLLGATQNVVYDETTDGFAGQYNADILKVKWGLGFRSVSVPNSVVKITFTS